MDERFFTCPGRMVFDNAGRLARFDGRAAELAGLTDRDLGAGLEIMADRLIPGPDAKRLQALDRGRRADAVVLETDSGLLLVSAPWPAKGGDGGRVVLLFSAENPDEDPDADDLARPDGRRLFAYEEAASRFSHELKNPLASALVCAQTLKDALSGDENLAPLAGRTVAALEAVRSVLSNLLVFTLPKNRAGFSAVDLGEVLLAAWALVADSARKQGNIRFRFEPRPVRVYGSRQMLVQVFLNLLKNALEAMSGGGEISVSMETSAKKVRVLVADTGKGMDAPTLARMFDPYFTTKADGQGIGLSICHNIIRLHGGSLAVSSHKSRGSSVWVELPRKAAEKGLEGGAFNEPAGKKRKNE